MKGMQYKLIGFTYSAVKNKASSPGKNIHSVSLVHTPKLVQNKAQPRCQGNLARTQDLVPGRLGGWGANQKARHHLGKSIWCSNVPVSLHEQAGAIEWARRAQHAASGWCTPKQDSTTGAHQNRTPQHQNRVVFCDSVILSDIMWHCAGLLWIIVQE